MTDTVISVENLSKQYRLGVIGGGTLREDMARWWARVRKKPDPTRKIGDPDHDNQEDDLIWALRDVNFQVKQGEIVGIIGRNGAGKSTLLKILSRITAPTSGHVKVKGRIGALLEVGTGFHPELTGQENVYLNGAVLGMTKAEVARKFDEIVDFSGVEQYIDTPVKRYSSGMKVRLAFAVAAHLEPEILIIDEVLAVGDAEFQKKCLGKMEDVASEGRTVLFVSHNMAAVQNLCRRALVLIGGTLRFDDNVTDGISYYFKSSGTGLANSPLSDIPRAPGLYPVLQAIRLIDKTGEVTNQILVGDSLTLEIDYCSPDRLLNPRFGITFATTLGHMVFSLQTRSQYGHIGELSQQGTVACEVPSIPLVPGEYQIWLNFIANDKRLDRVEGGISLHVEPTDVYGTGQLPKSRYGDVLVQAYWKLPIYA